MKEIQSKRPESIVQGRKKIEMIMSQGASRVMPGSLSQFELMVFLCNAPIDVIGVRTYREEVRRDSTGLHRVKMDTSGVIYIGAESCYIDELRGMPDKNAVVSLLEKEKCESAVKCRNGFWYPLRKEDVVVFSDEVV